MLASANNTESKNSKLEYAGKEHAVAILSESGNYRFTLYSKSVPIPLKRIHSWILKIEDKSGEPVSQAKLFVNGGMPAHRHGFPTKPVIKKYLGNGEYLVEGIKFTMPGFWEMRFTMNVNRQRERAIFKITLH
ncbi:MAG: FixH family protein [Gammaproteobacteria bacterium]|nr:FixH family protein [Gammaproteobacteria bacterium]MDH5777077.1 FixH family protein [Gammaproteobacteria bacterium]